MAKRILVVDDDSSYRTLISVALRTAGYEVVAVDAGQDALRLLKGNETFDLVVLDYRMPTLDGLDVLREMVSVAPSSKVLMVSAYGSIDMAIEAMSIGAHDFLRKPFGAQTIRDSVQSVLDREEPNAPIISVCREFQKTSINGFTFEATEHEVDESFGDISVGFDVIGQGNINRHIRVVLPAFMQELILAYIDLDRPPCGMRLWEAVCEEKLASFIWQNEGPPDTGSITIDDLSDNIKLWLDSILTIDTNPQLQSTSTQNG